MINLERSEPQIVTFPSGSLTLKGLLWKPQEAGPYPAILFNHGSALSFENTYTKTAHLFTGQGYAFFMPYRRGHGLSADQGPYIGNVLDQAQAESGDEGWSKLLVKLLETDHLTDQLAALTYLKGLPFVDAARTAIVGSSFGGIQTVLAAQQDVGIRAAVDFAGAAMTWASSEHLRARMLAAVRDAKCPIFFIQAENDFNIAPSRELAAAMDTVGKPHRLKIFPPFGETNMDGHRFCSVAGEIWEPDVLDFLNEAMKT